MSTLIKTDALGGDPTFAPIQQLAPEILAEIFLLTVSTLPQEPEPVNSEKPSVSLGEPPALGYGMDMQAARGQLAQVCRSWNTVLNDDPRVWATVALDTDWAIAPEIVTLWIQRSKSHPLDVYIRLGNQRICCCGMEYTRPIVAIFHTQLWRIRSLFWLTRCSYLSTLLPPNVSACAPMLQNLCILAYRSERTPHLGNIHCPDLRTLTIENCGIAVKSLISKPMPNVRHLRLFAVYSVMLCIKLLDVLPNLISLEWISWGEVAGEEPDSRVVLQSLKSLTLANITPRYLAYFFSPSLESLHLDAIEPIHALKIICQDWKVTLCHLTIIGALPETADIHFMLPHLTHLETLIVHPNADSSVDELLMALSSDNRDFTLACPRLKTMEINHGRVSTSALVDFVWRRVRRDSDDPVPGLMTSLKLSCIPVDQDVCEQIVKTHGSSVHIRLNLQTFIRLCNVVPEF